MNPFNIYLYMCNNMLHNNSFVEIRLCKICYIKYMLTMIY